MLIYGRYQIVVDLLSIYIFLLCKSILHFLCDLRRKPLLLILHILIRVHCNHFIHDLDSYNTTALEYDSKVNPLIPEKTKYIRHL